jgi:hypothetical protein
MPQEQLPVTSCQLPEKSAMDLGVQDGGFSAGVWALATGY